MSTLGKELISAVIDALKSKERGRLVRPVDVAKIRKNLGMTQKDFGDEYHIKLQTLRNWEQGKRIPDTTSLAYLVCIAEKPKEIRNILRKAKGTRKHSVVKKRKSA